MLNVQIEISGISPLLMHRFTDEAQQSATNGTRASSAATNRGTPQEQAEKSLYKDESGNVIMPSANLIGSITEGGKFFKVGKGKVTTQKTSLIPSCVFLSSLYYPLLHEQAWYVDARPVRMPSTGGRIIRYRACFDDWQVKFDVELDEQEMHVKLLREIIDAAGKKIGLGDFRPACKGPFGRYVVSHWTVEN